MVSTILIMHKLFFNIMGHSTHQDHRSNGTSSNIFFFSVIDVLEASKEICRSRRVKRILEIVLAFGNYMNRGNRANALGFKVNSLNKMVDTKSSIDKKVTLIHYLLTTVEKKVSPD